MGNRIKYAFVVDTSHGAGLGFEEAMFSYLTGQFAAGYERYIDKIRLASFKKNDKIANWLNSYLKENIVGHSVLSEPKGQDLIGRGISIYFKERPLSHLLRLFTSRAVEFCKRGRGNDGRKVEIPFVGCRLITTTEVQEVETLA